MNGCVCVHGQDVLKSNPFYPMAKNDSSSIPNGEEPSSPSREMFSVRSRILKTPPKKNTSVCNGDVDNFIGEESSGVYFAKKLDEEEQRISKLCFAVQLQMWENSPPEEGMSTIGSQSLLSLFSIDNSHSLHAQTCLFFPHISRYQQLSLPNTYVMCQTK